MSIPKSNRRLIAKIDLHLERIGCIVTQLAAEIALNDADIADVAEIINDAEHLKDYLEIATDTVTSAEAQALELITELRLEMRTAIAAGDRADG